jgi:hypothetical protein
MISSATHSATSSTQPCTGRFRGGLRRFARSVRHGVSRAHPQPHHHVARRARKVRDHDQRKIHCKLSDRREFYANIVLPVVTCRLMGGEIVGQFANNVGRFHLRRVQCSWTKHPLRLSMTYRCNDVLWLKSRQAAVASKTGIPGHSGTPYQKVRFSGRLFRRLQRLRAAQVSRSN